jgi:hypothetical protein
MLVDKKLKIKLFAKFSEEHGYYQKFDGIKKK